MDGFQTFRYASVPPKDPERPAASAEPWQYREPTRHPSDTDIPLQQPSHTDIPLQRPPSYQTAVEPKQAETVVDVSGSTRPIRLTFGDTIESTTPSTPNPGRTFGTNMGSEIKTPLIIVGVIIGIAAVLVVIIIPMSFSTLEFYELGFKRRKTTGEVDRSEAYGPGGRHFLGPDYEFRVLSADAHFVSFGSVPVFAKDRLQVHIAAHMQYFLRKDQIHLLHKKYDINYRGILESNALNALKNRATNFETREFIRNRTWIENELFLSVREMLSGPCCEKDCKVTKTCIDGCKSRCQESEFGFYVDVRYFQLDALDIPSDLEGKFLKGLVLTEETETEKYKQEASVVRKETDAKVKQIQNEAREISQNATSQSGLLRSVAAANATALVESSRSEGLKFLYSELDITDQKQKASFDYLRTLRGQDNVHLAVDFQQLIAGSLTGN